MENWEQFGNTCSQKAKKAASSYNKRKLVNPHNKATYSKTAAAMPIMYISWLPSVPCLDIL
jgi:hypothetical protein